MENNNLIGRFVMEDKKCDKRFAKAYELIYFERDEILRFFGAFIFNCNDYKFKIADLITDNFTANTYTISEILEILDENIKPHLQILFIRNCNLMKQKYWPLRLFIDNQELNFFYTSKIILKAFVADCALYLVSKKNNIEENELLKNDLKNYFLKVRKNKTSMQDVKNIREILYPNTAEYINNILGLEPDLPFVKQEIAEYLNFQFYKNSNGEKIFYPEINMLYDVLNYKIYSLIHTSNRALPTQMLDMMVAKILNEYHDKEIFDSSNVRLENLYDEFGVQDAWDNFLKSIYNTKTDYEKIYISADTMTTVNRTCDVCDEFHHLLEDGVKEFIVQSIYYCKSNQQKSLESLKKLLKLGKYNHPSEFEEFLLDHNSKIYSFYIQEIDDKAKSNQQEEYEKRKKYFNSSFMQLFYRELSGLAKRCIEDKEKLEASNSKDKFLKAKEINIDEWNSYLSGFMVIDNNIDCPIFDNSIISELERRNRNGINDTVKIIYAYLLRLYYNGRVSEQDLKCLSHKPI